MTNLTRQRDVPDEVLLGWLLIWGVVLTIALISALAGSPARDVPDATQTALGVAMGGLAAVWVASGTWVGLIHLPCHEDHSSAGQDTTAKTETGTSEDSNTEIAERQRIGSRITVVVLLLINLAVLGYGIRQDPSLVAQLLVIVMVGVTGPLLAWQYTRRRIYRRSVSDSGRQSIRQILGMVFTIALASAALRFADRGFGLSSSMIVLILSMAAIWTVMLWIMLGRWWWLIFLTLPMFAAQWLTVASLLDTRNPDAESQILRFGGLIIGFYFFAFLFLALMRSSGHGWLGKRGE